MRAVDLVVVTGSQNNVRAAYSSGTPAIGVGAGNVPVIVDASADLKDAAEKICASKIFDNATSCSSENSVTIVEAVYDDAIHALEAAGGRSEEHTSELQSLMRISYAVFCLKKKNGNQVHNLPKQRKNTITNKH